MKVKSWIIDWFLKNTDHEKKIIENNFDEDYLAKSLIDSFQFISFITEIEENFHISFSNDEFQNRAFSTINGLSKIIEDKINEKV